MGGAFVAIADDSSATWWNPAGQAAGPFLDASVGWGKTWVTGALPAWRDRVTSVAVAIPPIGVSYYRIRLTQIVSVPTAGAAADREEGLASVPIRSLSASQLGVTFVHSIFSGVHAGTTAKYVRGTLRSDRGVSMLDVSSSLARGDELEGGRAQSAFDLDIGLLAVRGRVRVGGVVRNVLEPEFEDEAMPAGSVRAKLPRQVRVGAAFDVDAFAASPLRIAVDADVARYESQSGDRRVVAVGAEQRLLGRRLAVRAGGRVNTAGNKEGVVTGGASIFIGSGIYVDGYAAGGGSDDERGWGLGARVSF